MVLHRSDPAHDSRSRADQRAAEHAGASSLRRAKQRAAALLLLAAVIFVVARLLEDGRSWMGYVRATAEAAMVGGLADWFAVTALFRHPLGLPIPHTAIIKTRKDQLGRSLGEFVEENFMAADVVIEKVTNARVAERLGVWLTTADHATIASRHLASALAGAVSVVRDEVVQSAIEHGVVSYLHRIDAAPLASRLVDVATADGRHHELVDAAARGAQRYLRSHRAELRGRFGRESPWWVPEPIDDRIFDKLYHGLERFIAELVDDPEHELRRHLDERLAELVVKLRTDPGLQRRSEQIKMEILEHPSVRTWIGSIWSDAKQALIAQSSDDRSALRLRLEHTAKSFGESLRDDPALRAKVDTWIEDVARYLVRSNRHEVVNLIETTVARWDGDEAARRIELQVGRDLQFIRINGTIVGGVAGLGIHAIGQLIG